MLYELEYYTTNFLGATTTFLLAFVEEWLALWALLGCFFPLSLPLPDYIQNNYVEEDKQIQVKNMTAEEMKPQSMVLLSCLVWNI